MKKLSLNIYIEKNILREINFNLQSKSPIKIKLRTKEIHKKIFLGRGAVFWGAIFQGAIFPGVFFRGAFFLESLKVYYLRRERVNFKPLNPANIYSFKVNNRSTKKRCEISSQVTMNMPE